MMERINSLMREIRKVVEELAQIEYKGFCKDDFTGVLQDAKNVVGKNKAAEEAIKSISLGKVFRDEITFINQEIFDNFMPITKAAEKISERYTEKMDKEAKEYPEMLKGRISKIQKSLSKIVERVPDGFVDPASLAAINGTLLPALEGSIQKLNQHVDSLTASIGENHSRIQMAASGLLDELADEVGQQFVGMGDLSATAAALEAERRKTADLEKAVADLNKKLVEAEQASAALKKQFEEEAGKNLASKLQQFERELKDLLRFIEKNPRYQVLYAITNSKSTSVSKLSSMLTIDESIVKAIVEDLAAQELVKVSRQESEVAVEIVQPLNPISCISSFSPEEAAIIQTFAGASDPAAVETSFQSMKELITRMRETDGEKAGFLASLAFFKMHESRSFHWFPAIRDTMEEVRPRSFYVRLVENMFSAPLHEKQTNYLLDRLGEMPRLMILGLDLKELVPGTPDYPSSGPFSIESITGADIAAKNATAGIRPELSKFATIQGAALFSWFSSKLGKIQVGLKDASGTQISIIVTDRALFDAEVVTVAHDSGAS